LRLSRTTVDERVFFIVSDLNVKYHHAVRELGFQQTETGFARIFPATSPALDQIFRRFALHAEEMILHAASALIPKWEDALSNLLERIVGGDLDWWLTGSAALAIRHVDVTPRDIDLVTTGPGARRLAELLQDWLVEPLQQSEGWVAKWFGRAFNRSRIEWVGDVEPSVDSPEPSDFGPVAAGKLEVVDWHGFKIHVPPLDLQLRVSERRGLFERARNIREIIAHS